MGFREEFIDLIAPVVTERWETHKLLPSITIAQAIHESDWGRSHLAQKAHNLFGVKGNYNGYGYYHLTWEVIDGKRVDLHDWFKNYPTIQESIEDHAQVFHGAEWRQERYKHVIGEQDYKKAAKALTGTYATDPEYGAKLIKTIETYNLTSFDPDFSVEETERTVRKVQLGGYLNRDYAEFMKDRLAKYGLTSFILKRNDEYFLQVGAFRTDEKLQETVEKLKHLLEEKIHVVEE